MKPNDHPVDRHQIAEEYRKSARLKEGHAGYWTGDLPEWRVSEYVRADIQVKQLEQYAHRAMMVARTLWKMAWALEHCVEHADCLANPELAKACLTDTLTPLHAICGPTGSLCALGWRLPPVPREHTCYGGCVTFEWSLWAGRGKQACAPSKRAPSRRCPRG